MTFVKFQAEAISGLEDIGPGIPLGSAFTRIPISQNPIKRRGLSFLQHKAIKMLCTN